MLPEPFYALREHLAIELPGARAVFTTRRGGFSRGPYASLNLGRATDDDPEAVLRNRALLEAELGVPLRFVRQVHGTTVLRRGASDSDPPRAGAEAEPADPGSPPNVALPASDGQVTSLRGLGLAALVADCLPIALADGGTVAMLHAGWRGLAAGVVGEGVRTVRQLDGGDPVTPSPPLTAAIGPGAGGCCYEVGEEVHEAFAGQPAEVHRGRRLDLKAIARHELHKAGVAEVHDVGLCTICGDGSLFYSHRRDRGVTGRQVGVAWLS